MEGGPFNVLDPAVGKAAVTEYLVWKYFPEEADVALINDAVRSFVKEWLSLSPSVDDPQAALQDAVYSGKYAWQEFVVEARRRTGEDNA